MNARNHHYLPQYYLKGFTENDSNKSKLHVFDFRKNDYFKTIPRNVGAIRDFNRIDCNGQDYNIVESILSKFDSKASSVIDKIKLSNCLDESSRICILNLIALLSLRSPQRRKTFEKFESHLKRTFANVITSKEVDYNNYIKAKTDKPIVSYDDFKSYIQENDSYANVPNEVLIKMEMDSINSILPYLNARNWSIYITTDETGPFITSDRAVHIYWNNIDQILLNKRSGPGFGSQDSNIYFPISKSIALIGDFHNKEGTYKCSEQLVSAFNSRVIFFAYNQIYSPKLEFKFISQHGNIVSGNSLIDEIKTIRPPNV